VVSSYSLCSFLFLFFALCFAVPWQNSKSSKKGDYRSSIMQAKSTLDSAINDFAQISDSRDHLRDTKASQFYDALNDILDTFQGDD